MKVLVKELELAKVDEEQDGDNKEFINTPPPFENTRPKFSLPVSVYNECGLTYCDR